MGKKHDHSKQGGFPNGHDTLKVTVTYKGHPQAIDDAIHGATRETEWTKNELDQANATIDHLVEVNNDLCEDLFSMTLTAEGLALELAEERRVGAMRLDDVKRAERALESERGAKWTAEDAKWTAERALLDTRSKLQGEIDAGKRTIAKLQAALGALGTGEISADDIAAFVASRKLSNPALEIGKPKVNPNGPRYDYQHNYPFALLMGDKEDVRKQVLDCYVDDPERRQKIQAIKNLRERTGLGLKESKELIEWAIGTHFTDR